MSKHRSVAKDFCDWKNMWMYWMKNIFILIWICEHISSRLKDINMCILQNYPECSNPKLFYIIPYFCGQHPQCRYRCTYTHYMIHYLVFETWCVINQRAERVGAGECSGTLSAGGVVGGTWGCPTSSGETASALLHWCPQHLQKSRWTAFTQHFPF